MNFRKITPEETSKIETIFERIRECGRKHSGDFGDWLEATEDEFRSGIESTFGTCKFILWHGNCTLVIPLTPNPQGEFLRLLIGWWPLELIGSGEDIESAYEAKRAAFKA